MTKEKRIIMNVTKQKASGQRRINIPKSEKNLESEQLVEIKKVKIK